MIYVLLKLSPVQGIIGVNIGIFKTYLPVDCNMFVKISLYWTLFYSKVHSHWSFWSFERDHVCELDTTCSFYAAIPMICCWIIYRVPVCEVVTGRTWWECRKYGSINSFTVRTVMYMHCGRSRYELMEFCLLYFQTWVVQCDYKWCEQLQKLILKKVVDAQKLITLDFKEQLKVFSYTKQVHCVFSLSLCILSHCVTLNNLMGRIQTATANTC